MLLRAARGRSRRRGRRRWIARSRAGWRRRRPRRRTRSRLSHGPGHDVHALETEIFRPRRLSTAYDWMNARRPRSDSGSDRGRDQRPRSSDPSDGTNARAPRPTSPAPPMPAARMQALSVQQGAAALLHTLELRADHEPRHTDAPRRARDLPRAPAMSSAGRSSNSAPSCRDRDHEHRHRERMRTRTAPG